MSLNVVTLTGTIPGGAGGYARFEPSGWLTDTADAELIPPRHQTVTLDASGSFSLSLLATDNAAPLPAGWTWKVTIGVPGVAPNTFSFLLPYAGAPVVGGAATRDIAGLTPVEPAAAMAAYLPLGGGTLTGPLTLAADPATGLQAATRQYVDTHGDKTYTQAFTAASTVTVAHGLAKYPSVTVVDSAGDEVEGDVVYLSTSSLTVSFSAPFSGSIYCN